MCMDFKWGEVDGEIFCKSIKDAYEEVMHWKRNCFLLPSGRVGKDLVLELVTRLFQSYADT